MFIDHPYIFSIVFLFVAGVVFSLPVFRFMDSANPQAHDHNHAMDSLRYFLASFVFISHGSRMIGHVNDGTWKSVSPELNYMATLGVSLFFCITAVLFWGKIKESNINFTKLYINRFFRIVPLIWFNSIVIIIITCVLSMSFPDWNVLYWFDPLNNNRPDFNGFRGSWALTGGVFWTLVFEWGFYFTLPFLFFFRKNKLGVSITLMFVFIYISDYILLDINFGVIMPFVIGMLAIDISERIVINKLLANTVFILSVVSLFYFLPKLQNVASISNFLMLLIMICVIKRADAFGFLKIKGFQRLGAASYSIYIMHALVLFISFKVAKKFDILNAYPSTVMVLSSMLILLISAFTYKYIEMPFIRYGRKLKIENNS